MSKLIKRFINDNKGQEITKHEGNFSLLVWGTAPYLIYSPLMKKYYDEDFGTLALLTGNQKGVGFFNLQNYFRSTIATLDKYLLDKNKFTELKDYAEIENKIQTLYEQYTPEIILGLKEDSLVDVIIQIFELLRDWQVITLFCEAMDEDIAKKYFDRLSDGSDDFDTFFANSTALDFKSFLTYHDETLAKASTDILKSQWLYTSYLGTPELSECSSLSAKLINERGGIEEIKKAINSSLQEIENEKIKSDDFRAKLNGKLLDLFDFIKISVSLRDTRKVFSYKAITVLSNLAREFCNRKEIPTSQYNYLLFEDFIHATYKSENYPELIKDRVGGFLVYYGRESVLTDYVDFDEAKVTLFNAVDELVDVTQDIRGNIGCKGITSGPAKIILSHDDFNKFSKGDILVTSMTRPEFVPLMKKAKAVITDEGGITCHAAIVSRELNIPCVIGTKNATRILKDGDMVEVDADKGIVKIIK